MGNSDERDAMKFKEPLKARQDLDGVITCAETFIGPNSQHVRIFINDMYTLIVHRGNFIQYSKLLRFDFSQGLTNEILKPLEGTKVLFDTYIEEYDGRMMVKATNVRLLV